MPFIVGLTGGIGSGKSAVAALFEAHGVPVIDTDAIAHELTASGGAAIAPIRECFGPDYIAENGALDRAKMRDTVFADPAARHRLEGILHPLIRTATAGRTLAASGPYVILMIPLLVESGKTRDRAQRLLVVDCTEDLQLARTMARSGLAAEQVRAIMASQASRAERLAAADDVIDNNGAAGALQSQVDLLHARYRKLADAMPKA